MHLEVRDINSCYILDFSLGLNYVTGNSSTGKTFLTTVLSRNKDIKTNASEVLVNPDYRLVEQAESNAVIIVDLDDTSLIKTVKAIAKTTRNDLCVIVLGRTMSKNLPISCNKTFTFETVKCVTKNKKMITGDIYNPTKFSNVFIEDEKSGFKFFSNIFANTSTTKGKENICNNVKENNLVVFDSVGFGAFIEEFMAIANIKSCAYLGYSSFEVFILETIFNYTEQSTYINEEKFLESKLREIKNGYSKSVGCTGSACSSCNQSCKTASVDALKKSRYSDLIKNYSSAIKKYQQKFNLSKEELKSEVERLKKVFGVTTLAELSIKIEELL